MGKKDFCCAEGCSHERSKGATCKFYKIPDDQKLRSAWLTKIARVSKENRNGKVVTQPWKPGKSAKLCGCHFENPPPPKSRRKCFLVPSIFSHRPKSTKTPRRPLKERTLIVPSPPNRKEAGEDDTLSPITLTGDMEIIECRDESAPDATPVETCQPLDHDYIHTTKDEKSYEVLAENPDLEGVLILQCELENDREELNAMKASGRVLTIGCVKDDNKLFHYYTGLQYDVFCALLAYLEPKAKVMKYPHGARTVLFKHHADVNKKKPGRGRSTSIEEEMFFTLVKLKLGLQNADCAVRFGISATRFSSIFTSWVILLSQELEKICKMPPTVKIDATESAECFSEFPNVRVIIDCTELFAETPSSIGVHKQFHSNYKHHTTVKFLVGMNTGGAITYISEMFGGRASDKFITNVSEDLVSCLNAGENVMADRGFTIQEDLPAGVKLVIPSFKHKDKSQFTKVELQTNKKISEARVHIERAIRRIKQFQILQSEMKLSQVDIYSHIFKACGYLVNFQNPFLKV